MLISSRNHPNIKLARALRTHKERGRRGLFLVEGIRHVGEAVEAVQAGSQYISVEYICYAPDLLTSEFALQLVEEQTQRGLPCYAVSEQVFVSIAAKENPQGIVAVVRPRRVGLGELNPQNFPWGIGLVSPQDPGNIGTILRTTDAVGAGGVLLLENSADPYHPASVRASMGALFWYPVVQASFEEFILWAREQGYAVYGSSAHGNMPYHCVSEYERPLILLLGSEREGLTSDQADQCRQVVRLPMYGRVTSLNLAVAAGILLYDIVGKMKLKPDRL